jgi:hypothetical protein
MNQTEEQKILLNNLELALAGMVFDNNPWSKPWGKIIEYLQNEEPEIAVLEGESYNVDKETLDEIKKTFDIRY